MDIFLVAHCLPNADLGSGLCGHVTIVHHPISSISTHAAAPVIRGHGVWGAGNTMWLRWVGEDL